MTRSDPPLPLARLRARDELVELHAADLRFSQEEREIFLRQAIPFMQSSLSSEAGSRLFARTEGWAAGLRLLALALQGRMSAQEIEQYLSTFSGSHRHFLEYFVTEVLDAQPQPLQVFLLQTSVLSRLTGSLCDAVTGRNDSEQFRETVDRAGLFLLPLDGSGQWYRYHALFAEAMQHEARRRLGEDALRSCYGRASSWYEQHGMLAEAIEAALSAGDFARTAILIERLGGIQYFTERHELYTLQHWLEQLPESVLHATPALCFIYANALVFASVPDQLPPTTLVLVEALLQKAEQGWRSVGDTSRLGEVLAFRALLAVRQGEIKEATSLARQALAWLPEGERFSTSRIISLGIVGEEARQAGQFDAARKIVLEALALCEAIGDRPGRRVITLGLGDVCYGRGELHQAAECYRQVLTEADDDLVDRAKALLGLAQLSYERNELEAAEQEAQEALELGKQLIDKPLQVHASLVLARVLHACGETRQAQDMLQALLSRVQPASSSLLQREVLTWQARLQLAVGDLSAMRRWVSARARDDEALPLLLQEQEELLIARWLLAQGEVEEVLRMLERWQTAAIAAGRTRSALEIRMLMSLAHHIHKQAQEARQLLREVLSFASAGGYRRLFLDVGTCVLLLGDLLRWTQPQGIYWLTALLAIGLVSLMSAGLGVALGAAVQGIQPVMPISINIAVYLFFLAGGISVLAFTPEWLQNIAAFIPLTYGRHALEMAVFYNSSDLFGRDMAILGVSALIALGLGVLSMRRGIAS